MKINKLNNAISIVHDLMEERIRPGNIVLDGTVGNGNDIMYMSKLIGKTGKAYGFDIQNTAIENTRKLLSTLDYKNFILIKDGHEFVDKYVEEPLDFIVYNLGYLPRGDKTIKTKAHTTKISIEKSLNLLKRDGMICIVAYPGHEGGMEEQLVIQDLLSRLNQKNFNVLELKFINQKNSPPILYIIQKINSNGVA